MYAHTQRAGATLLLLAAAALFPIVMVAVGGRSLPAGARATLVAVALVLTASALVFSRLTIRVEAGTLTWYFGPGVWRKSVPVADVAEAMATTTSFVDGWGIHLTRRGWLYNVAGRRAVLISRRDGDRFLLGTDDVDGLLAALRQGRGP